MRWAVIDGYGGYEVSDTGLVRRRTATHKSAVGTVLKQSNMLGYRVITLFPPRTQAKVHRLVAEAFLPNPDGLPMVAHINGVRHDNRAENLMWATCKENLSHRKLHGTEIIGKRNGRTKLSAEDVVTIRARYKRRDPINGAAALAKEYGVTDVAIIKAARGTNWGWLTPS